MTLDEALTLLEQNATEIMGDSVLNERFTKFAHDYVFAQIRREYKQ